MLQCAVVRCSVLQYLGSEHDGIVRCSVLQYVAVRCSVLQCRPRQ